MLDVSIIKTLNTKNISPNTDITKKRVDETWKATTKQEKEKAVEIGGYTDTRSFNKTRTSGFISVRMAIALAVAFNVDPYYIIGTSDVKSGCDESRIKTFMKDFGFGHLVDEDIERPIKSDIMNYVSKLIDGLDSYKRESVKNLSNEELETLLSSTLIKSKISNDEDIKIFLLKVLLTQDV